MFRIEMEIFMNQSFYDKLSNIIGKDSILPDEPMSRHTTFRVGGPADFFVTPKTKEEVRDVKEEEEQNGKNCIMKFF